MSFHCIRRIVLLVAFGVPTGAQHEFWNYETPHVHPLERTLDGGRLLAVNTPDQRLEVFAFSFGLPVHERSIPVGLEPVSVRARTSSEVWVVNHLSDSITVLNPLTGIVSDVLPTDDEPCDVVFSEDRAFVSCSQANTLLVFDTTNLNLEPTRIHLDGEDPRALAVGPDGSEIYVAFYESGNATTILGGGFALPSRPLATNAVSDPDGPYGGINPPPNDGIEFNPPIADDLPPPPPVSLVVRRDAKQRWFDDNGTEWTDFVSGPLAVRSGRLPGWELLDHDVAVVQAQSLEVSYAGGLMNMCMSMAVHPSGAVHVVGTDPRNYERFEPILNGRFLQVVSASFAPDSPGLPDVVDLNPHIEDDTPTVPQTQRDLSLGDPRGIVWSSDGSFGYVSGMGSNNVIKIDGTGTRQFPLATVEVGEGPTGMVLIEKANRLFVLNKFAASISVIDTASSTVIFEVPFFDPTLPAIKVGRKHLYDTHKSSGTGVLACASCHVDARTDKMVWDLGNPAGELKSIIGQNTLQLVVEDWHPMKGPTRTQTLQDIIGKEPLHWRGDRDGIEEFNGAFVNLQGDDEDLTEEEMQEFEDFLATLRLPPNPFRNLDNTLPVALPLPGQFSSGATDGPHGIPLPPGNAVRGRDLFTPPNLDEIACATCHTLPATTGTDYRFVVNKYIPFPTGPKGEHHSRLVHLDGFTNHTLKPAQLRTVYENIGFNYRQPTVHVGFGFLHDGAIDSLSSFLAPFGIAFGFHTDQDVADMIAFLMSLSGPELPEGSIHTRNRPPGASSLDSHAAIGHQIILNGGPGNPADFEVLRSFFQLANDNRVGVVAHGQGLGNPRGFYYLANNVIASDRQFDRLQAKELFAAASAQTPLTWTVVPAGSAVRMGVDRDADGVFDRDEIEHGTDPSDPNSFPCLYAPDPPSELTALAVRRTSVDLEWVDGSFSEEGFHIQFRTQGQAGFITAFTAERNATSARIGDLTPDLRHQFRVVAFNCAGDSQPDHVTVSTLADRPIAGAGKPKGFGSSGL